MRLHIELDDHDFPEFETFGGAWRAIRGVRWSLTNTPLGEYTCDQKIHNLLDAIHEVETHLRPLVENEETRLVAHRERRMRFASGDLN